MNCDLARTEMIAYLQGELPAGQKTAIELHLAGCPDCRAQLEEARRLYHDDWVAANLVKFFADGSSGLVPPLVYAPSTTILDQGRDHAYEPERIQVCAFRRFCSRSTATACRTAPSTMRKAASGSALCSMKACAPPASAAMVRTPAIT